MEFALEIIKFVQNKKIISGFYSASMACVLRHCWMCKSYVPAIETERVTNLTTPTNGTMGWAIIFMPAVVTPFNRVTTKNLIPTKRTEAKETNSCIFSS